MRIAVLAAKKALGASEIRLAIQRAEMEVIDFSWDTEEKAVMAADGYILVASSAVDIAPPWLNELKIYQAKGKPVLGLGYGSAVFLAENGLIPGLFKTWAGLHVKEKPSLGETKQIVYVRLSPDYQYNAFTRCLNTQAILALELAKPAQFIIPPGLLMEITAQGLPVFLYCNAQGELLPGNNIAAISNKMGNVMALLPTPEMPTVADALIKSLKIHLDSGYVAQVEPLYYWPRR